MIRTLTAACFSFILFAMPAHATDCAADNLTRVKGGDKCLVIKTFGAAPDAKTLIVFIHGDGSGGGASNGVAFNSNTGETTPLGASQPPVPETIVEPVEQLAEAPVTDTQPVQTAAAPKPAAAAVSETKPTGTPAQTSKMPENWDTPSSNPEGPIPVPEPGSMLILAAGTAIMFGRRRLLRQR